MSGLPVTVIILRCGETVLGGNFVPNVSVIN